MAAIGLTSYSVSYQQSFATIRTVGVEVQDSDASVDIMRGGLVQCQHVGRSAQLGGPTCVKCKLPLSQLLHWRGGATHKNKDIH